ncbi:MAG: zinc ribbon domain-containing protein [Verrucomicrobiota bacterium]
MPTYLGSGISGSHAGRAALAVRRWRVEGLKGCRVEEFQYHSPMPIYEFHCQHCAKDSEILVRSTHWEGTSCPHCGSKRLNKKLSVFASSVAGESAPEPPSCSGNPRSCRRCGTGVPHSH